MGDDAVCACICVELRVCACTRGYARVWARARIWEDNRTPPIANQFESSRFVIMSSVDELCAVGKLKLNSLPVMDSNPQRLMVMSFAMMFPVRACMCVYVRVWTYMCVHARVCAGLRVHARV